MWDRRRGPPELPEPASVRGGVLPVFANLLDRPADELGDLLVRGRRLADPVLNGASQGRGHARCCHVRQGLVVVQAVNVEPHVLRVETIRRRVVPREPIVALGNQLAGAPVRDLPAVPGDLAAADDAMAGALKVFSALEPNAFGGKLCLKNASNVLP